ncbi:outer membrane protein assembly factor [Aquiflexum gelatinilyticum]|uniref:outer membrane protein assembly factor n=1 Tax=Aquiflexum gelatinilyticum TaxID=2961943 RepID=UPI0021682F39|nr:outer membrane protein assembly factor [Aquiflexum gelatinilyticum]MCS4436302.1 outer membrane protein assembly factor [Aquiflexum gelatinilyticum]
MKTLILSLAFFAFLHVVEAQDTTTYKSNKINDLKWVPLPAVGSNPANGWMFGLAPSATWYMGNPADTKMSNLVGNFLYTTKKQWIFSSRSNIFLDKNKWILVGDWRYFITSQPTFGLGSSAPNIPEEDPARPGVWHGEQQMDFNLIRFYETVLRRIGDSKFYLGMGYHFDLHSKINSFTSEENAPTLEFSHDAYNLARGFSTEKYVLSGVTLNAIMENRDIAVSPYEKNFALLSYKINPTFLGSDQSSSTLLMDYRHYFNLSERRKRHLIAVWGYGNFLVTGNLPYMNLPSIGWDMFGRSGRAYAQGRFRGESMVYTEAEYRFPLQQNKETFGGTVFVNAGSFSSRDTNEKLFEQFNPGYGLGLRVMINKKNRTTITADYGWGQKGNSGFYLNVNESF